MLLTRHYVTPVVTWSSTASATDLREHFFYSQSFFTLHSFLFFQAFPGPGSSTSKLAWLHTELWSKALVRLFVWITTIHKRYIYIYILYIILYGTLCLNLKARADQSQNISLYRELVLRIISLNIRFFELSSK